MASDTTKQALLEAAQLNQIGLDELMDSLQMLLPKIAPKQTRYKVSELPDTRTIRYYISQGLLPKPINYLGGRANYSGEHILKLLWIKKLQTRHYSLRQIKQSLDDEAKLFANDAKAYEQHLVAALLKGTDEVKLQSLSKKKAVPQRLRAAVDRVEEAAQPYVSKTTSVKFSVGEECHVYVSESTLRNKVQTRKTAHALRQLADELEKDT